jgi:pimeloyl-ACP methyl ester carboxylesterase
MTAPLPPALEAEVRETNRRAGRLAYYVAGAGTPLLLIHSINAAASAYEVRPVFERLRHTRRVFAVDLPGYGLSDRSRRRYDIPLFVDALRDMLDEIGAEAGTAPVDALAVSLASEFLARLAVEQPKRFRTLALVTPTGFRRGSDRLVRPAGGTREIPGLHAALNVPLWASALFNALASRASIRYFLQRTWGSEEIDEGMVDYAYLTTHQPGARHAPLAFLSGRLFSADIRAVYEQIRQPVWVPHGTRGDFRDFSEAGWTGGRRNWTVQPFDTGALPHFEQPDAFMAAYRRHLARAA